MFTCPSETVATASSSRRVYVLIRWVTLLLLPVLMGMTGPDTPPLSLWLLLPFLVVTIVLQLQLRRPEERSDTLVWYCAFAVDLLVTTGTVITRGGLQSNSYMLYALVTAQAALLFGMWPALVTGICASGLYTAAIALVGEVEMQSVGTRCVFLLLIALSTAYLATAERRSLVSSFTDPKTELPHFRHFRFALAEAVDFHRHSDLPLSVAILHVDQFKPLSGHPRGERVIQQLIDLLARTKRSSDILAPYESGEWILLLPGTNSDAALRTAERLRSIVSHFEFTPDRGALPARLTITVGVSSLDGLESEKLLLVHAIKALQTAKQMGSNRVCRFPDDMSSETALA